MLQKMSDYFYHLRIFDFAVLFCFFHLKFNFLQANFDLDGKICIFLHAEFEFHGFNTHFIDKTPKIIFFKIVPKFLVLENPRFFFQKIRHKMS